jgi:uncharacterized DUF497 family protein
VQYEWDITKNNTNQRKHGLSFEQMRDFDWPLTLLTNSQFIDLEERELWLGPISRNVVVVERGDEKLRIISLRQATNQEISLWKREIQNE